MPPKVSPPDLFIPASYLEFAARKLRDRDGRVDICYFSDGRWCVSWWGAKGGINWWDQQIKL